jgi:hypothetical protein
VNEFEELQAKTRTGIDGWWERVIPQLTEQQQADLAAACANQDISHATISIVLGRWGHKVSFAQVGHYRRRYVL